MWKCLVVTINYACLKILFYVFIDRDVKQKLMSDAMFKLEHESKDQIKLNKVAPTLSKLEEIRDGWKDDFAVNQLLRRKFREEKKDIKEEEVEIN